MRHRREAGSTTTTTADHAREALVAVHRVSDLNGPDRTDGDLINATRTMPPLERLAVLPLGIPTAAGEASSSFGWQELAVVVVGQSRLGTFSAPPERERGMICSSV